MSKMTQDSLISIICHFHNSFIDKFLLFNDGHTLEASIKEQYISFIYR